MRPNVFSLLLFASLVGLGHGQNLQHSITEEVKAKAENLLIDFVNSRSLLPGNWACRARNTHWAHIARSQQLVMMESTGLVVVEKEDLTSNKPPARTYFAFGVQRRSVDMGPVTLVQGLWEQELVIGDHRFRRDGSALNPTYFRIGEDNRVLNAPDGREHRMRVSRFDPYFLSIVDHGGFLAGGVQHQKVVRDLIERRQIVYAREDPRHGLVTGVFRLGTSRVYCSVQFSQNSDWMPVSTSYQMLGADVDPQQTEAFLESLKAARVHSHSETRWMQIPHNGKMILVPFSVKFISNGVQDSSSKTELTFHLKWRFGVEVGHAIPQPSDSDWREGVRRLFDEDFERPFDESIDGTPAIVEQKGDGGRF